MCPKVVFIGQRRLLWRMKSRVTSRKRLYTRETLKQRMIPGAAGHLCNHVALQNMWSSRKRVIFSGEKLLEVQITMLIVKKKLSVARVGVGLTGSVVLA